MPGVLGGFLFAFKADTKGMQAGIERGNRSINRQRTALKGLRTDMRGVQSTITSFVGAYAGLAGFRALTRTIDEAAQLGATLVESSRRAGLSIGAFQELQRVFEGDGLAAEKFEKATQSLAQRITYAGQGLTTYTRAFERLGVSWANADGSLRGIESVLADLADAFPKLTSHTEKLGLVQQLFGTRAAAVLTVLDRGSESLAKQREEMRALGVVTDDSAIKLKAFLQLQTDLENRTKAVIANRAADNLQAVADWERLKAEAQIAVSGFVDFLAGRFEVLRTILHDFPAAVIEAFQTGGNVGAIFGARAQSREAEALREQLAIFDQIQTNTKNVAAGNRETEVRIESAGNSIQESWEQYWAKQVAAIHAGRMAAGKELDETAAALGQRLEGFVDLIGGTRQEKLARGIARSIRRAGQAQAADLAGLLGMGMDRDLPAPPQYERTVDERVDLKTLASDVRLLRSQFAATGPDLRWIGDAAEDSLGTLNNQLQTAILQVGNLREAFKRLALSVGFSLLSHLVQGGVQSLGRRLNRAPLPSLTDLQDTGRFNDILLPPIPSGPSSGVNVSMNFQSAAPAVLAAVNRAQPRLLRAAVDVQDSITRQELARARVNGSLA